MKRITTPVGPLRTQARSDAEGGGPHPIAVELHPEHLVLLLRRRRRVLTYTRAFDLACYQLAGFDPTPRRRGRGST